VSASLNFEERPNLIPATAGVRRHSIKQKLGHLSSCNRRSDCLCEVVALHESGHAIAAYFAGLDFQINLCREGSIYAHVAMQGGYGSKAFVQDASWAKITLAGPLTEGIISPMRFGVEVLEVLSRFGWQQTAVLVEEVHAFLTTHDALLQNLTAELLRSRLLIHTDGHELVEKLDKELKRSRGLTKADFEDFVLGLDW
jgi:hypothetical protein